MFIVPDNRKVSTEVPKRTSHLPPSLRRDKQVVDENIITQAKIKKRQGENKTSNELEDIINEMVKLEEANDLPTFIATSDMVKKMPVLTSIDVKETDISDVMNGEEYYVMNKI